jgi:hypothetical protein
MKILQILGWDIILSKRVLRVILTIFTPLIMWYLVVNLGNIFMSFILWEPITRAYLPFYNGSEISLIMDRIFLFLGVVFAFTDPFKK